MTPILSTRNLSKIYGVEYANRDVNIDFYLGRVHAVIGENGAGKSTLMKMLFGLEKPHSGEILYRGELIQIKSPQIAKSLQIAMVHQHFMLAENLTVKDHIQLEINSRKKNWWVGPYSQYSEKIRELQNLLQLKIPLNTLVRGLSVIQKQKLEILKTLLFDPQILFFDEPTAVLPPSEVREFYNLVEKLKNKPTSVVIVTHKLQEVMSYADEVTVLRHGEIKFHGPVREQTANELARYMVGDANLLNIKDTITDQPEGLSKTAVKKAKPVLHVHNFSLVHPALRMPLRDINLTVNEGEIVAFAGVEGNGQTELLNGILFPELCRKSNQKRDSFVSRGRLDLLGRAIVDDGRANVNHVDIRQMSIGWIGEDRLNQSAIADYNLSEHFRLLPHHRPKFSLTPVSTDMLKLAQKRFDIRPPRLNLSISGYSGGNQQKWVVARETSHAPKLLIAAHPTRGVDFAAAKRIHEIFRELCADHKSVIFLSSDLDEVCDLADRIFIFFKGQMTREFCRPFRREVIGEEMAGRALQTTNGMKGST